jgi:hypothetical protein
MAFRPWFTPVGLLFGALLFDGCSASDDAMPASVRCVGSQCDGGVRSDAAPDRTLDVGTPDQHLPLDSGAPSPLCGRGCDPDDEMACVDGASAPQEGGRDAERDGAVTGSDASPGPEAGPRDSGLRRDVEGMPSQACQVRRSGSERSATCGPAGYGQNGNPCVSSADCAAGLACVGDDKAALCRPYCCKGSEGGDASHGDSGTSSCPVGDFCAERPLRDDADSAEPLRVPVCVTAEKCSLFEQYPCPPGPNVPCICPAGTACTVVRNDGTTGCVEPGTGVQGEACSARAPCAAGHLCSRVTSKCVKLCSTTATESDCGNGRCQAASGLPANWGVCVGLMGDGG